jgi:hypothetical protein
VSTGKKYFEKIVAELRSSKERCLEKFVECVKKIKTSFANMGAYSSEDNFITGDPEGVIEWISSEAEAFEEILSDRGDVCAFSGAGRVAAILEKAGCEHVKTLAHDEAGFSINDTKDPSAEASSIGGNFFTDIWENGGRGMAHLYYSLRTECRRPQESVLPPRVRAPTPPPPLPLVAPPDPDPCPSPTHRSRPCANGGGGRVVLGGGPFAGTGGARRGAIDGTAGTGPVAPGRAAEGGGSSLRTAEATATAVTHPPCACLLLHSTGSRNPRQAGAPPPPKQSVAASSLCSPTALPSSTPPPTLLSPTPLSSPPRWGRRRQRSTRLWSRSTPNERWSDGRRGGGADRPGAYISAYLVPHKVERKR